MSCLPAPSRVRSTAARRGRHQKGQTHSGTMARRRHRRRHPIWTPSTSPPSMGPAAHWPTRSPHHAGRLHGAVRWARDLGTVQLAGVEGTSCYGMGLTSASRAPGIAVVEVIRPDRSACRRQGKSDPLDACIRCPDRPRRRRIAGAKGRSHGGVAGPFSPRAAQRRGNPAPQQSTRSNPYW